MEGVRGVALATIVVTALLTLFLAPAPVDAAPLNCTFRTACGGEETPIFRVKSDSGGYNNSHAQLLNLSGADYPYFLCCGTDQSHTLNSSCSYANAVEIISAYAENNSHVELPEIGKYNNSMCLGVDYGNLSCTYPNGTCGAQENGIFSIASSNLDTPYNMSNAHVGNYSYYLLSVCCQIGSAAPYITSIILNSTFGTNTSAENLTSWVTAVDPDNDPINLNYDWRKDGTSIAVLNMNFDVNNSGGTGETRDYSTFSNNGTLGNGTAGTEPVWDATGGWNGTGVYTFDGVNDVITIPDNDNLSFGDGSNDRPFSISGWFYLDLLKANTAIVSKASDPFVGEYYILFETGNIAFFVVDQSTSTRIQAYKVGALTTGKWMHVVATYDGSGTTSGINIYVDGTTTGTGKAKDGGYIAMENTDEPVAIGRRDDYVNGTIDEVRIWNRTLSAAEALALYNNRSDLIVSQETTRDDIWQVCSVPNDGTYDGNQACSETLTILNSPPTMVTLDIESSEQLNSSRENITVTPINLKDADVDPINVNYDWRRNGTSIAVLNMNFDVNNSAGTGVTKDYSTYSFNGTVVSAIWNSTGGWNGTGAYSFDGSSSCINVTNTSVLDLTDNFTMMAWVRTTDTGNWNGIFSHMSGNPDYDGYQFTVGAGPSYLGRLGYSMDGTWHYSTNTINDGNWHHAAVVINQGTGTFYIDGTVNGSFGGATAPSIPEEYLYIGCQYGDNAYYEGQMDDARIFNSALSPEQIQALYNNRSDLIVSQETVAGENWSACATPNDGYEDGAQYCSVNLTILRSIPTIPELVYPADQNESVFERNVTLDWLPSIEGDGDQINYSVNLTVESGTCSVEHQEINILVDNFTTDELCTDQYYNWTIRACDVDGCSDWAATRNFTIASVLGIKFLQNASGYGSLLLNSQYSTEAGDAEPMVVENDGNVRIDVDIMALAPLFETQGLNTNYFQFKVAINESGAFNEGSSATSWTNVPDAYTAAYADLSYIDISDDGLLHTNITVPGAEPPGTKNTTLRVRATQG